MRRGITALATSFAVLLGSGLLAAAPARAASLTVSDADCTAGVINGTPLNASTNDEVRITGNFTGCRRLEVSSRLVTSPADFVLTGVGIGAPTFDGFNYAVEATSFSEIRITFTNTNSNPALFALGASDSGSPSFGVRRTQWIVNYTGTGGGGGGSSSSTSVLETLTLEVSTGSTTCTGGSPTGYTGTWLQLPAADACSQSGPNANPNAKLLGWATSPAFPVPVAQQIVDLKYGPMDNTFDGVRMIFIPAGGWTYISGSNTLYPIWSS